MRGANNGIRIFFGSFRVPLILKFQKSLSLSIGPCPTHTLSSVIVFTKTLFSLQKRGGANKSERTFLPNYISGSVLNILQLIGQWKVHHSCTLYSFSFQLLKFLMKIQTFTWSSSLPHLGCTQLGSCPQTSPGPQQFYKKELMSHEYQFSKHRGHRKWTHTSWSKFHIVPPFFSLKKHRKNCECCPVSPLIVRQQRLSWIQVLNCRNRNQCLKCHKSVWLSLSFPLSLSLSMSLSLSFFVRPCPLITLIKCLKGHKSLGSLFEGVL